MASYLWIPDNVLLEIRGLDLDSSKILTFVDNEHSPIIAFDTEFKKLCNDVFVAPLLDRKNPFIL